MIAPKVKAPSPVWGWRGETITRPVQGSSASRSFWSTSRMDRIRQAGTDGQQFRWLDRLGHVDLIARQQGALTVFRTRERGQRDRGGAAAAVRGKRTDFADEFVAVFSGHADVAYQNRRTAALQGGDGFGGRRNR